MCCLAIWKKSFASSFTSSLVLIFCWRFWQAFLLVSFHTFADCMHEQCLLTEFFLPGKVFPSFTFVCCFHDMQCSSLAPEKGVGRLFDQSHFCQLFLADMKEILLCTVDMEGLPSFVSFHVRLFSSLAKKMLAGCLINLIPVDGSLQKWRKSCCGASSFTMCSLFLFGRIILVVVSSIWWEAYTTLPPYKQQVAHATVEQCCLNLPG